METVLAAPLRDIHGLVGLLQELVGTGRAAAAAMPMLAPTPAQTSGDTSIGCATASRMRAARATSVSGVVRTPMPSRTSDTHSSTKTNATARYGRRL